MNGHKYPREFERITKDGSWQRLRVAGGWEVWHSTIYLIEGKIAAISETGNFIPDPDGDWVLESE